MKQDRKMMLTLLGWTLLSGGIYFTLIYLEVIWGVLLYLVIAGILLIAFVIINKGMSLEKPAWDDFDGNKRYNLSKYLILFAFPLFLFSMLDLILLLFGYNISVLFT